MTGDEPPGERSDGGAGDGRPAERVAWRRPATGDRDAAQRLPRSVLAVVAIATVAGLLAALTGAELLGAGAGALVAGLVASAGLSVVGRGSPAARGAGSLLLVCAGVVLLVAAGVASSATASTSATRWSVALLFVTALAVVAATSPRGVDADVVTPPTVASAAGATGALLGGGVLLTSTDEESVTGPLRGLAEFLRETAGAAVEILAWTGEPAGSTPGQELEFAVASGCLLVALAAYSIAIAGSRLDPARLAARPRRPEIRERVARVAERCGRIARLSGALFGVSLFVGVVPLSIPYDRAPGLTDALAALVGATPLRAPLVLVAVATWTVLFVVWLAFVLASARDWRVLDWLPAFLGGAVAWLGLALVLVALRDPVIQPALAARGAQDAAVPLLETELSEYVEGLDTRVGLSVFGVLVALGGLASTWLLGTLWAGSRLGYLDGPSSSGSVAGASLVIGGLAAGALGAPPVAVVVPVAAGLVAWDAAQFGGAVAAETGANDGAPGPVLTHVAATAAVAVAASSIALATASLPAGTVTPSQRITVLVAIVAGLLLLLWLLQRVASGASASAELSTGLTARLRAHPLGWSLLFALAATVGVDQLVGLQLDEGVVVLGLLTVLLWWTLGAGQEPPDVDPRAEPPE